MTIEQLIKGLQKAVDDGKVQPDAGVYVYNRTEEETNTVEDILEYKGRSLIKC